MFYKIQFWIVLKNQIFWNGSEFKVSQMNE